MDFRCPSCQKDLTVPDEYAGQLMKCPLCQNTFQAPALPPPVAPMPPVAPETYGVVPEPAPSAPPPPQEPPRKKKEAPAAPPTPLPPVPTGDYTRTSTIWVSPRVVPWIAPAALVVAFLLTFFPWAEYRDGDSHIAWGWGWGAAGQWNILTVFYTLMLLAAVGVSGAITAIRLIPGVKLPPAVQQIWPWRAGLVGFFAFLGLFFLMMQLIIGFNPNSATLHTTGFVALALLIQFVALVGALLDFWLEVRGPSRPMPRIDLSW
jgi:hypothetical protein